jgi:hypothetical protein
MIEERPDLYDRLRITMQMELTQQKTGVRTQMSDIRT